MLGASIYPTRQGRYPVNPTLLPPNASQAYMHGVTVVATPPELESSAILRFRFSLTGTSKYEEEASMDLLQRADSSLKASKLVFHLDDTA